MKLSRTTMKNFRAFEDMDVVFDQPLSIIRGANHSGKTSLVQGIKLGLSKSCDGTDPRGAGAADKIRIGATKAELAFWLSGRADVEVRVSYGPGRVGRQQTVIGSAPGISEAFEQRLEAWQERLSCVLDSDYFTNPKTDQKAILAGLVIPESHQFDEDVVKLVEKLLGKQDWTRNPAELIDWIYGDEKRGAYGERKLAKAALNAMDEPSEPQAPEYTEESDIQRKLTELRRNLATESAKVQRASGSRLGRAEQHLATLKTQCDQENAKTNEANLAYEQWDKELLSPAAAKKHQKTAANRPAYDDLGRQILAKWKAMEEWVQAQDIYRDMLADPLCPTCTQPISKDFVDKKIEEFQQLIQAASEQRTSLLDQQKALGDVEGAEKALALDKDSKDKRDRWRAEAERAEGEVKRLAYEMGNAQKQVDAAKAEEQAPPDMSAVDAVNGEIGQWEGHLRSALQYQSRRAHVEQLKAKRLTQQERINELERLCSIFGKDGIKATLIQQNLDHFNETVNTVLAHWGYSAEMSIEPYSFDVTTAEEKRLPLKELSGSERLMFAAALQTAVAVYSGIKMVVIDRADTFINVERGRLFTALEAMLQAKLLDQAIVMVSDERAEIPQSTGVGFYRVSDGKVVRL